MNNNFAYGADIGWISQLEDRGFICVDENGNRKDIIALLKDLGVNSIRLRVFVNPPHSFEWTKKNGDHCLLGYSDADGMLEAAKRAAGQGMRLMVDFHYSDHFADPEYQDIPEAWKDHTYEQLLGDVYNHTFQVMTLMAGEGIYPDWVQVGNEINPGLLLPMGDRKNQTAQMSGLLNSGYDAVKAVSPGTKVITHLAEGHDQENTTDFFDQYLFRYNGKTDIIGLSYYPYWIQTDYTENIHLVAENLKSTAARYEKEVMICEVGGLDSDVENSAAYLKAVINALKGVPGGRGTGIFYWEPEANSAILPDKYPLGAARVLEGKKIQFTDALKVYKET